MEILATSSLLDPETFKYKVFALMKHDEFYDVYYAEVETLTDLSEKLEPFTSPVDIQRFLFGIAKHDTPERQIERFAYTHKAVVYLQSKGLTVDIMYTPVETINGRSIEAKTRAVISLDNIEEHLPNHIYFYSMDYIQAINPIWGMPVIAYKIRYGV